jgi:hypothetical protein
MVIVLGVGDRWSESQIHIQAAGKIIKTNIPRHGINVLHMHLINILFMKGGLNKLYM